MASEIRYFNVCNLNVPKISWSHHLRTNSHKQLSSAQISDLRCIRNAFRNRIETYRISSAINLKPSDQIYSKMLKKNTSI